MKKNLLVLGAALTLLLTPSACGRQTVIRTTDTLDQAEPEASAAEPLPAPAAGEEETAWSLDPAAVTDDFAADTLIRLPELALSGLGFTFDTPRELTSQQLYLLFLAWSAPETLDACYNAADSSYIFSADLICQTLDRYLEGYSFDISECPLYDPERGAVITPMAGAFGGNVEVQLESKTFDGNTVVLTALLDGSVRKTYTVTFCDGGYRYQSVRQLSQPELRPNVGTLLLYGKEQEAFAAVTEEEICLWDRPPAVSFSPLRVSRSRFPAQRMR